MKLRTKLVLFFFLAVMIISLASLYMYLSLQKLTQNATELFKSNLVLTDTYRGLGSLQTDLDNYLTTNGSDELLSFYDHLNELTSFANALEEKSMSSRQYIGLRNTAHMIRNYLKEAEATVVSKRGRNIDAYTSSYTLTTKNHQIILRYIENIMSASLIESTDRYNQIARQIRTSTIINILLTLFVVSLIIFLIYGFSKEVTQPISKLASYSTRIAHGEYDLTFNVEKSNDEIGTLYDSFQYMVDNISVYIESLKDKVRLEKVLAEERLHNLKMQAALKEAELSALQAQVNPHFMFNTLNIGAKLAQLQNDPITCDYLENTAAIFRYNLKGLHTPATLKEEIENARSYLSLLKTRFGDLLTYYIDIDSTEDILDYKIPRMTLQPLVENAYIHGISDLEEGGTIRIQLTSNQKKIQLTVIDTGVGFNSDFLSKINTLSDEPINHHSRFHHGHTTGIGLNNLIQRLRYHTHVQEVIAIDSKPGLTQVTLLLPRETNEVNDV
jgi:sensor histidine kinase YesM